jgi:hypothetical protein
MKRVKLPALRSPQTPEALDGLKFSGAQIVPKLRGKAWKTTGSDGKRREELNLDIWDSYEEKPNAFNGLHVIQNHVSSPVHPARKPWEKS